VGGGVARLGALVDVRAPVVVCPPLVVAGGGGGGGAVVVGAGGVVVPVVSVPVEPPLVTVKSPFIKVGWASHWKWYEPATSVTVHVVVPVPGTVVAWSTPPGPLRWKLWKAELSCTSTS
jgi:hypothetical protein